MATESRRSKIYGLFDPQTKACRYVGFTRSTLEVRLSWHARDDRDNERVQWIQGLLQQGKAPIILLLEEVRCSRKLEERERFWIALGRSAGWPLFNRSDGGEGVPYNNDSRRGKRPSVPRREKTATRVPPK